MIIRFFVTLKKSKSRCIFARIVKATRKKPSSIKSGCIAVEAITTFPDDLFDIPKGIKSLTAQKAGPPV